MHTRYFENCDSVMLAIQICDPRASKHGFSMHALMKAEFSRRRAASMVYGKPVEKTKVTRHSGSSLGLVSLYRNGGDGDRMTHRGRNSRFL